MFWNVTTSQKDAKIRMKKTIEFQKTHDTYLVYEKVTNQAIGFAGVEKINQYTYQETGICLGPNFVGKGYGKQILLRLIQYCRDDLGAKEFVYITRKENEASKSLAQSLKFKLVEIKEQINESDGKTYTFLKYALKL